MSQFVNPPAASAVLGPAIALALPQCESIAPATRVRDYVEIVKPRIAVMLLLTVTVGYGLGCQGDWRVLPWLHALLGVALAAVSSSALNQYIERHTDRLMSRTSGRGLPSGRLHRHEVLAFAVATAIAATVELALFTNLLTALLTLATIAIYAGLYTPLKPRTAFCTVVGAVAGALPPVLGWTAAGGSLGVEALSLFMVLFLWQFPHFLAIAWRYRHEYARAGLRMLPGSGSPRIVGITAAAYALALVAVSLLPGELGLAGRLYSLTALLLSGAYAAAAIQFAWRGTDRAARRLLLTSLVHLPALLGVLLFDHWRLLQ